MVKSHSRCSGQALSEYVLILFMLSLLGVTLMNTMIGSSGNSGAINSKNGMVDTATQRIADDAP